jgi:hypothetical protein
LLLHALAAGAADSCSVNPRSVSPGDSANVFCNCDEVTAWSASGGLIRSNGARATLDTTGVAPGSLTISGNCKKAGIVSAFKTFLVIEAPPPPPQSSKIVSCELRDRKRQWRVDNWCLAGIDDVAGKLKQDLDLNLVIVGNAETDTGSRLAALRAVNAKAYLVHMQKIASQRIEVRTGREGETLDFWPVPAGSKFSLEGTERVDEQKVKPTPGQESRR